MKIFEAFAGYGSQRMALRNIGVPFQSVGVSEIDKYAIKAYEQIHGDCHNFGDITAINWKDVPHFDLFTYSFPCTDISSAGNQKGLSENSGTRSSLLWECKRAIECKKPKILLMENVKALASQKFINDFLTWQNWLSQQGYTNFAQILNAKHYGVAQNRERLFMVSILGNAWYRFPDKEPLTKSIADYLEESVPDKYYLSEKMLKGFQAHADRHNEKRTGFAFKPNDLSEPARAITTNSGSRNTDNYILYKKLENGNYRFYRNDNKKSTVQGLQITDCKNESNTITTTHVPKIIQSNNIVRRLTPRECFRLMGVSDEDFNNLNGISDTQLYKLAGNSIVVPVLEKIFKNLNI